MTLFPPHESPSYDECVVIYEQEIKSLSLPSPFPRLGPVPTLCGHFMSSFSHPGLGLVPAWP